MFSSIEHCIGWARDVLEVRACTYPQTDMQGIVTESEPFVVVSRTGGDIDYPHDFPDVSFQCWAQTEAEAEELANQAAIALKLKPMDDPHVNSVGTPRMYQQGRVDGRWFIWNVNVSLGVNLQD